MFPRHIVLHLICICSLCYICVISHLKCFIILHQYFQQCVYHVQYGFFFLQFLDFVLSCVLLRYFLNDFKMVSFAPVFTGITLVFTFHTHCISVIRSLYLRTIRAFFLIIFLSPEIARAIHNTCSFFIITDYDVWFIVRDGSVSLHLLIPLYGYLTFRTSFY